MSTGFTEVECQGSRDAVSDYLDGMLVASEHAALARHLGGCEGCSRFLEEIRLTVRALGRLRIGLPTGSAERRALDAFQEVSCGVGIQRKAQGDTTEATALWRELSPCSHNERLERVASEERFQTEELCAWLLAKAEETVSVDPRAALGVAEVAVGVADLLDVVQQNKDLHACCWSCLAMARTAVSDLVGARQALERAEASFGRSEQATFSKGRLLVAKAWISFSLGRLADAETAFLSANRIFEALGERQRAVCVQITLSGVYVSEGRNHDAIRVLTEALSLADEKQYPARVLLAAQNNLAVAYCELDRPAEVVRLLPGIERLARRVGGDAPTHYHWLKGTVARVQGEWGVALRVFFEVREHFRQRGECIHYLESSLDALRTYVTMGDWASVSQLATETGRVGRGMTRDIDTLRALTLLENAAIRQTLDEVQIRAIKTLIGSRLNRGLSY